MGVPRTVFRLYANPLSGDEQLHILLACKKEGYRNAVQSEEDAAEALFDKDVAGILRKTGKSHWQLVGEFQEVPASEAMFSLKEDDRIQLWVSETKYGRPWVILGMAKTEEQFWQEVEGDEDLIRQQPKRPAKKIDAVFVGNAAVL